MARRYTNISTNVAKDGRRYRRNPLYPQIPVSSQDIYIIATEGDRYDTLALQFYGDSKLWWIIASANNMTKASLVLPPGEQIRIPASKEQAIELYNAINADR